MAGCSRATAIRSAATAAPRVAAHRPVEPTPYQRDQSETHVKRLIGVIEKVGRFLDPIIAIRQDDSYWTPNGSHRLRRSRARVRTIIALLVPEPDVAFRILALNTEKAHNLREKSLEAIRMARALARKRRRAEAAFFLEFEEPALLTLGICYEQRPASRRRLPSGAQADRRFPRRADGRGRSRCARSVADKPCSPSTTRWVKVVEALKAKGLTSPYLKNFVVAKVNFLRFKKGTDFDFDETLGKIIASAQKFNVDRVRQEDVARAGGGAAPDEE